jgi:hypothetical protein
MQVFEPPDAVLGGGPVVPDGRFLAAWNRGGVYVIDNQTGAARTLWAG